MTTVSVVSRGGRQQGNGFLWVDVVAGTHLVSGVNIHSLLHEACEAGVVTLVCRLPDSVAVRHASTERVRREVTELDF